MVLAGGPDREREISLMSGKQVAEALRDAGHEVIERDVLPDDLSSFEEFSQWGGDVVFPVMHGPWGEGGDLQHLLDERQLRYVGSSGPSAALCMNKHRTKLSLEQAGLPTPASQLLAVGETITIEPPLVIKPLCEGSSIDLYICHDEAQVRHALACAHERHSRLLVEQFIDGMELTVGVIADATARVGAHQALAPIRIIPATSFYDYEAKYFRDDTQYVFGAERIGLSQSALEALQQLALDAHRALGCRHLSRVDFMMDEEGQPWIIEVNTMPGFTTHSLLPMAAAHDGIDLPALTDRLVRITAGR